MKLFPRKTKKLPTKLKTANSILDLLNYNPERFSFSKSIDIVLLSQQVLLRNLSYSSFKNIELKSSINFSSKYSDIKYIEGIKEGYVEIATNLDGVAGIEGALPDRIVENFIFYNRGSKQEVVDFLNIFNGRFLIAKYLFLKKYDITCFSEPLQKSIIGKMLFSFAGFDFDKNSMLSNSNIPEQLKISCQHFFWKKCKSSEGLRVILSNFCKSKVQIKQFSGRFVEIASKSQSSIGNKKNKYNVLASNLFLGNKVWNQTSGIDIIIGPLDFENYIKFLPKNSALDQKLSALEKIKSIVKEYVPFGVAVNLHFKLSECFVNELILNGVKRLNKDSFMFGRHNLKTTEFIESV